MKRSDKVPLQSPLNRIKNLSPVDDEKVSAMESRLKKTYVVKMTRYSRQARLRAEKARDKILY